MEDDDAAYNIERMPLLLAMKRNMALVNPGHFNLELQDLIESRKQLTQHLLQWPNGQPFNLEQLSGISGSLSRVKARIAQLERIVSNQTLNAERIKAIYLSRLAVAPLLEVNDVDSAEFANWMHDGCKWRGTACIDRALDADLRADIVEHLDHVPYRIFKRIGEDVVFDN